MSNRNVVSSFKTEKVRREREKGRQWLMKLAKQRPAQIWQSVSSPDSNVVQIPLFEPRRYEFQCARAINGLLAGIFQNGFRDDKYVRYLGVVSENGK